MTPRHELRCAYCQSTFMAEAADAPAVCDGCRCAGKVADATEMKPRSKPWPKVDVEKESG